MMTAMYLKPPTDHSLQYVCFCTAMAKLTASHHVVQRVLGPHSKQIGNAEINSTHCATENTHLERVLCFPLTAGPVSQVGNVDCNSSPHRRIEGILGNVGIYC